MPRGDYKDQRDERTNQSDKGALKNREGFRR